MAVEIPPFVCTWSKCKTCKNLEKSQNVLKKYKTRVHIQNASKISGRIANASISDDLRRILV
jgi:nitrate/TMAO reductase-like tetraheme cytochrome c subunit